MREPGELHPSMRQAETWPLAAVETGLLVALAYILLLMGLVVARHDRPDAPAGAGVITLLRAPEPAAAVRQVPPPSRSSCVRRGTVPRFYAEVPNARRERAFGPPVEPSGPRSVAEVNGELWRRLCGGAAVAGGAVDGPDRRLYVALDAVVNGRDPNRRVTRGQWSAGVDRFIARDAQWTEARVVTRRTPAGSATYAMAPRRGADPLVIPTRLRAETTSRFLVLPVRAATGRTVTLTLRLPCGFQPTGAAVEPLARPGR